MKNISSLSYPICIRPCKLYFLSPLLCTGELAEQSIHGGHHRRAFAKL